MFFSAGPEVNFIIGAAHPPLVTKRPIPLELRPDHPVISLDPKVKIGYLIMRVIFISNPDPFFRQNKIGVREPDLEKVTFGDSPADENGWNTQHPQTQRTYPISIRNFKRFRCSQKNKRAEKDGPPDVSHPRSRVFNRYKYLCFKFNHAVIIAGV